MSATATAAAPADAAAAPPAKKKGGALKLILAVVISAGAAGGGAYVLASKKAAATKPVAEQAEGEGDQSKAGDEGNSKPDQKDGTKGVAAENFSPLAPQFVVNLNDPEAMRFLQVEVQVIASKAAAMEAVKLNDPIVRNRLMLLFSSQTYHALLTREGKEKLQAEAHAEINKLLDEHQKPHINGVVFTNFVMQ